MRTRILFAIPAHGCRKSEPKSTKRITQLPKGGIGIIKPCINHQPLWPAWYKYNKGLSVSSQFCGQLREVSAVDYEGLMTPDDDDDDAATPWLVSG